MLDEEYVAGGILSFCEKGKERNQTSDQESRGACGVYLLCQHPCVSQHLSKGIFSEKHLTNISHDAYPLPATST
jgi:hypothetical protein